jgi:cytochrome c oxidase cbb3-type subunit III
MAIMHSGRLTIAALSVLFASRVLASPADLGAGRAIFQSRCAPCHGLNGGGGRGPDLRRPKLTHAGDEATLKLVISSGISPGMPAAWYLSPEELENVAAFVLSLGSVPHEKLAGDSQRGKLIYVRSNCAACHILDGDGTGIGPDLTAIGTRRGAAQIRATLIDPSKTLQEGFLLIEAVTATGKTIRGIRLNEDTFTIQIKDRQAKIYSFRKTELAQLKKLRNETIMPPFGATLSASQLDDLVAYLVSPRGNP